MKNRYIFTQTKKITGFRGKSQISRISRCPRNREISLTLLIGFDPGNNFVEHRKALGIDPEKIQDIFWSLENKFNVL